MKITHQHKNHDHYRPNGMQRSAFTNVVGIYIYRKFTYYSQQTYIFHILNTAVVHVYVWLPGILQSLCSCCNQQSWCQYSCSGSGCCLC